MTDKAFEVRRAFRRPVALAVIFAGIPICVLAEPHNQNDWSVYVGLTHSDNVNRDSTDKTADTSADAGLNWHLQEERARLTSGVAANLEYTKSAAAGSTHGIEGGASAQLLAKIVPEHFYWVVQDNFGQALINGAQASTLQNRENVNYFSTGPQLRLPMGSLTELRLDALASQTTYQLSNSDSKSYNGDLSLSRRLSLNTNVALGVSDQRVEYPKTEAATSYDIESAYLDAKRQGARGAVDLRLGYTELKDSGRTSGGLLALLSLTRRTSAHSDFALSTGTNFSNSAETFRVNQIFSGVATPGQALPSTLDGYRTDFVNVSWSASGSRFDFRLGSSWDNETHQLYAANDLHSVTANFSVGEALGPRTHVALYGTIDRRIFKESGARGHDESIGVNVSWKLSRTLAVQSGIDRFSGGGEGLSNDFTENRIWIRLSYAPAR